MNNRRWNSGKRNLCCCVALLFLLTFVHLGCQPIEIGQPGAMSGSSVPVKKSGTLMKDEAWAGLIIVEGDVTVPNGMTLTIDNGTKVRFSKDSKLLINGSLYAEGQPNIAITLTSASPERKPGDWGGIIFSESSLNSRIEFCVIDFHQQIICRTDSLRLTDSIIAESNVAGIICDSASPIIEDNMITKNEVGIRCEGSAAPTISHNSITANFTDGIECKGASFANISYNAITNNRKNGISCYSASSPEITYNNIMHNGGWAVYDGGKMTSNFIQGNKEQGVNTIDNSRSPYSDQFYGVENVESPLSSRIIEAGVRKKERW
ncbi:right-handed parallel beta-helix repeat-containing protein [Candidatus Poribacteria bacterium]